MFSKFNLDREICKISSMEYEFFLKKANVIGVALGYKIKSNICTYKKCLKVLVTKKFPMNTLFLKDKVFPYYKGIQTDVVETGIIKSCGLTERIRPTIGGCSVGPRRGSLGGSLGCVVRDSVNNYYILCCAHVFASKGVSIGDPILQPSRFYGGWPDTDTVGALYKYIPLKYSTGGQKPENYADCAIAKVVNKESVSSKIVYLGNIKGMESTQLGQKVKKVGCISGLTTGKIVGICGTVEVKYDEGLCLFKNQIITDMVSETGDSGALVLNDKLNAVGMVMSGSSNGKITTCNPIESVLDMLGVRIVY